MAKESRSKVIITEINYFKSCRIEKQKPMLWRIQEMEDDEKEKEQSHHKTNGLSQNLQNGKIKIKHGYQHCRGYKNGR